MAGDGVRLTVRLLPAISRIAAEDWDACAGSTNPFVSHAFLKALEDSGSVGRLSGWLPIPLVAEDAAGRIVGAMPMYLKSHSYGEYVFDHGWAEAYERAGGDYYPKLQISVPFTPVTGPRLLIRPGAPPTTAAALIGAVERVGQSQRVSSAHVTFPSEPEWQQFGAAGWLRRIGHQYHWENRSYRDFDDFLDSLSARKRKAIRRERREVTASGVALETLSGDRLRAEHWDAFYRFYMDTGGRKWGQPYLNRDFFHRLGAALGDQVVLVMARLDGHWIAGALNLCGGDTLYGRNWGAVVDIPFLHFEACYYQAIDYAIAHRLQRVEAGAQGEHKIQRGYLPVPTYSAHWVRDEGFRRILDAHLAEERHLVASTIAALAAESPYRQDGAGEAPAGRGAVPGPADG